MSEKNVTPSDPNNPTTPNGPQWGGDPNSGDPNSDPNDPQQGSQARTGDGVDPTTGSPASSEAVGDRDTTSQQTGGGADGKRLAGANDPNAPDAGSHPGRDTATDVGTNVDGGLGSGGAGYGGPVKPSEQDDVTNTSRDSFPASDSPSYNPGRP